MKRNSLPQLPNYTDAHLGIPTISGTGRRCEWYALKNASTSKVLPPETKSTLNHHNAEKTKLHPTLKLIPRSSSSQILHPHQPIRHPRHCPRPTLAIRIPRQRSDRRSLLVHSMEMQPMLLVVRILHRTLAVLPLPLFNLVPLRKPRQAVGTDFLAFGGARGLVACSFGVCRAPPFVPEPGLE